MSADLVPACALMLAALLLGAAVAGLRAAGDLPAAVDAYAVLPAGAGRIVAPILIASEMIAGVGLLFPATRAAAGLLCAVLLGSFSFAVLLNVMRGTTEFNCGCGKLLALRPGVPLFLRNVMLCLVSVGVTLTPATRVSTRQLMLAVPLLLMIWCINAVIARMQWPADD